MTTWTPSGETGAGWEYNQLNTDYNSDKDPSNGNDLLYNSSGATTVWTAESKN